MNHKQIIQQGREMNNIEIDDLIEQYEEKKNNWEAVRKTLNRIYDRISQIIHPPRKEYEDEHCDMYQYN